ncbi:MAG: MG2 domain-containing protein, partial [Bacteroidota bacterium]
MMEMPPLPAGGDYAAAWTTIDSLEQEGLLRSALEKTESLQKRAADDKNGAQSVKCLLFRGKFTTLLEEDGLAVAMLLMETEAGKLQQPEKSVMQSLLGEMYPKYHANKRWEISQRTPLSGDEGGDILTWSGARIARQASDLYAASVEQAELLKTVPVSRFRDVLNPGQNDSIAGQPLRASLYDLLAHRAIEYYSNDLNFLNVPVYEFILDQDFAFAPHREFQNKVFDSQDGYSGKWRAVRLFQDLLKEYDKDNTGDQQIRRARLYDADLARLQFVYANSVLDNKTDLYRKALENLEQESRDNAVNPEIVCVLARLLVEMPDNKAENAKMAVSKLEDAIRRFPATLGAIKCESLLAEIRKPHLSLSVESVSLPGKHILASVGYSNLGKVFVKVVQSNFNDNSDDNWGNQERIRALKSVSQLIWTLRDPADYQSHRTEISVDPLQPGRYWLLVSDNPGFDEKKGVFAYAEFSVSNIAATTLRAENKSRLVFCDRTTGAPLSGVKVDFFYTDYRRDERKLVLAGSSVSDKNGVAEPVKSGNRDYLSARASLGTDSLWIGGTYDHGGRGKWRPYPVVNFFTDRVIYRPGQTVYFKGIVFQHDEQDKPEILQNKTVTVTFFDVNDTKKGELTLKSNAFGTFNGAFTAPTGGLTGTMRVQVTEGATGSVSVRVEEYKRPRFEVKFNPVKGSYRLNDPVTVTGEARNYAGNAVDGARVRYRVVREARFPYFFGWYRSYLPSSPSREIISGTTTTDINGNFSVNFDAVPDQAVARKDQPVFSYTVYADITDITGETRSQETTVSAAWQSLQVNWLLPQEISVKDLAKTGLTTTNMAGEAVPAEGNITFQKLVEPRRFFLERYWDKPDLPVLAQPDFESKFPDLAWGDEDNPLNWGREDFTRTVNFNTAEQATIDLSEGKTGPGWYIFKLSTTDSYGEKIEVERIVRVFDDQTTFYTPGARMEKESSEPGEKAVMILGGKPANLHFFVASGKDAVVQWIKTGGKASVSFPVTEDDRGGLSLAGFCVRNNRYYILNQYVSVPWSNKDLQIRYETFRDKLAPGEKETWKIHISGPKKDKVAAEMVATLYDASLDQFIQHQWRPLPYPQNGMYLRAENQIGFGLTNGYVLSEVSIAGAPDRSYPALNWFDFPFWNAGYAVGGSMVKAAFRGRMPENAVYAMSDAGNEDMN